MTLFDLVPLLVFIPLLGALISAVGGRRLGERGVALVASGAAALTFVVAALQFVALRQQPQGATVILANWINVAGFQIPWGFQIDTLAVTMMLLVSGVGTLIHIYAIGYMHGDAGFARFFAYMNLFLAAMLLLVSANNYLMLFAGWEGVGLCSYLLISFWFDEGQEGTANARAGRKAFIVNRVGDAGFIVAMTLMAWQFGSLSFDEVFAGASAQFAVGAPLVTAVTLLLLWGATGKSAQLPLFVWLPDAMAGPTPVSALIHAATMVTAGVYLIIRSHVLFELAPLAQGMVVFVGAATALLAATIAAAQVDIKRVLAYSTISQLGFMMAAVGMGAYTTGLFHLVTHAFFKALLFLAAGSVIHGMAHGAHGNEGWTTERLQDMRLMGGLRRRMPLTFWPFLIGGLALAGVPPLAGFFSKDEIMAAAFGTNWPAAVMLLLAAGMTAFYVGRQLLLVFWGAPRSEAAAGAVESSRLMTWPLLALAGLTVLGGLINLPGLHSLGHWLEHTLGEVTAAPFNVVVAAVTVVLALLAGALAYFIHSQGIGRKETDDPLAGLLGRLYGVAQAGWGIDALYAQAIVAPYGRLSALVSEGDGRLFETIHNALTGATGLAVDRARRMQSGQLQWNVAAIVIGLIVVLLVAGVAEMAGITDIIDMAAIANMVRK